MEAYQRWNLGLLGVSGPKCINQCPSVPCAQRKLCPLQRLTMFLGQSRCSWPRSHTSARRQLSAAGAFTLLGSGIDTSAIGRPCVVSTLASGSRLSHRPSVASLPYRLTFPGTIGTTGTTIGTSGIIMEYGYYGAWYPDLGDSICHHSA